MIKDFRLHRVNNGSNLKAYADIVVDEQVLIKSVRVINSDSNGLFVSMPKQKAKDDKWYDTVKLLDDISKEELQIIVLEAYNDQFNV